MFEVEIGEEIDSRVEVDPANKKSQITEGSSASSSKITTATLLPINTSDWNGISPVDVLTT
eukprot:2793782-Ditylum_brightwellii.AAC.1